MRARIPISSSAEDEARQFLRIAVFVGSFPVVSETFILRQITGLLDLGHDVEIFADSRSEETSVLHEEIQRHRLLERTTFIEGPPASLSWEMPVSPINGSTWLPGAELPISNLSRIRAALPAIARCFSRAPRPTLSVLNPRKYHYRANSLSGIYRLSSLLKHRGDFDVLHAHFGPIGNSFRFARTLWKAPLIVSFHGYDFCTVPRQEGRDVYKELFATADLITANSNYTSNQLEHLGCPIGKLRKLSVGLDPAHFPFRERAHPSKRPIRLITVARLVEIKGHEFVIRSLGSLLREFPGISYDIVGDGPLRPKLEALVCELHLEKVVIFHGAQRGTDVIRLMHEADLFALTSVTIDGDQEGQGLVLQEAQACGLPVIATDHGAFPEGVLPGKSSFLVPERDVNALAERLRFLIQCSHLWLEMGRAGRRFVEQRYDIRQLNQRLTELYREAIESYPGVC